MENLHEASIAELIHELEKRSNSLVVMMQIRMTGSSADFINRFAGDMFCCSGMIEHTRTKVAAQILKTINRDGEDF